MQLIWGLVLLPSSKSTNTCTYASTKPRPNAVELPLGPHGTATMLHVNALPHATKTNTYTHATSAKPHHYAVEVPLGPYAAAIMLHIDALQDAHIRHPAQHEGVLGAPAKGVGGVQLIGPQSPL
eukprot:1157990-Pelagomonas_calceolata.AAC.8